MATTTTQHEQTYCRGRRRDGRPCRSTILLADGYCIEHSPSRQRPRRSVRQRLRSSIERDRKRAAAERAKVRQRQIDHLRAQAALYRGGKPPRRPKQGGAQLLVDTIRWLRNGKEYREAVKHLRWDRLSAESPLLYPALMWLISRNYRAYRRTHNPHAFRELFWGKRLYSAWRYHRDQQFRAELQGDARLAHAHGFGRLPQLHRLLRDGAHRRRQAARLRARALRAIDQPELRHAWRLTRWSGRLLGRAGGRMLALARERSYRRQWAVGGHYRKGAWVRPTVAHRRQPITHRRYR